MKALFRRGRARSLLGQTQGALEDLSRAAELAPEDAEVQRELRKLQKSMRAEKAAGDELFRGKLASSPQPASEDAPDGGFGSSRIAHGGGGGRGFGSSGSEVGGVVSAVVGWWTWLAQLLLRWIGRGA